MTKNYNTKSLSLLLLSSYCVMCTKCIIKSLKNVRQFIQNILFSILISVSAVKCEVSHICVSICDDLHKKKIEINKQYKESLMKKSIASNVRFISFHFKRAVVYFRRSEYLKVIFMRDDHFCIFCL